jgi:hypothetical protein
VGEQVQVREWVLVGEERSTDQAIHFLKEPLEERMVQVLVQALLEEEFQMDLILERSRLLHQKIPERQLSDLFANVKECSLNRQGNTKSYF